MDRLRRVLQSDSLNNETILNAAEWSDSMPRNTVIYHPNDTNLWSGGLLDIGPLWWHHYYPV